MAILGKAFEKDGRGSGAPPRRKAETITVYDKDGGALAVSIEEWRNKVLPATIQKAWDDPGRLYQLIVQSLKDGFIDEVVEASERLREIDGQSQRSAVVLGIVYLRGNRLEDAGRVLEESLEKHGDDGAVLTNLAKVQKARGEDELSEKTLWRALEVDPNLNNGLLWYEAIYRERDGVDGGLDAMRRVAALPGSWRARLWLARAELESGNLEAALKLYEESFANAPTPVPTDLLIQVSGDLGRNGHLKEIIQIAEPKFDPAKHGIVAGGNLVKAHMELGNTDDAKRIIDQLKSLGRPDWKKHIAFLESVIAGKV